MARKYSVSVAIVFLVAVFNVRSHQYINESMGTTETTNNSTLKNNENTSVNASNYKSPIETLVSSDDSYEEGDASFYDDPINYNVAKYITKITAPKQKNNEEKFIPITESSNKNQLHQMNLPKLQSENIKVVETITTFPINNTTTQNNTERLSIYPKLNYSTSIESTNSMDTLKVLAVPTINDLQKGMAQVSNISTLEVSEYRLDKADTSDLYKSIANISDLLRTTMPKLISGIQDVHNNINRLSENGTLWEAVVNEYYSTNTFFIVCSSAVGLVTVLLLGLYALLKRFCKR